MSDSQGFINHRFINSSPKIVITRIQHSHVELYLSFYYKPSYNFLDL